MTTYHSDLVAKRSELIQLLRTVKEGVKVTPAADHLDQSILLNDRDFSAKILNQEQILLREVEAAITRISQGVFGTCGECGEKISPARLKAVPWADLCVACQTREEEI